MKDGNVHQLAYQKSHNACHNDPHALAENRGESIIHIWNTILSAATNPKICRRKIDSQIKNTKSIRDYATLVRNPSDSFGAIKFVYNISDNKLERPQQNTT